MYDEYYNNLKHMFTTTSKSINPIFMRKSAILVVRNCNKYKTKKTTDNLSSYGLTQSYILGFSLRKIMNMNNLGNINQVFVKKKSLDSTCYNSIEPYIEWSGIDNITEYESSISPEKFMLEPDSCKLIVGSLNDLWGDKDNKFPHESSILYALNKYFDVDNENIIFPESGKSVYIYNKNRLMVYNTHF